MLGTCGGRPVPPPTGGPSGWLTRSLAASYPSRPTPALPVLRSGWRLPARLHWNFLSSRLLPPWPDWAMGRVLLGPEWNTAHLYTQHVVFSKHLYA